jgi:enoyl-CoA hydratase
VIIDFPPVNALPVRGWFDLADAMAAASAPGWTSSRCSRPPATRR